MNRQAELAKKGIGLAKGKLRKKGKIFQDDPKLARKCYFQNKININILT